MGATLQNAERIVCLLEGLRYYSRKLQTFLSTRIFKANLPTNENWHLKNMVRVAIFRVAPKKHGHCCGTGGRGVECTMECFLPLHLVMW